MAKIQLTVTYENGDTTEVSAGQRDIARWEGEKFGGESAMNEKPVTFARYIAWAALKRSGEITLSWPGWDATVDEVDLIEDEADSDPTSEVAPATA
jgi:hypothetical protein